MTDTDITRPRSGMESMKIAPCPFCGGGIAVKDCGYSSFNPGTADCEGTCKRHFPLGMVEDKWDAGKRWNKYQPHAKEIEELEVKLANAKKLAW